MKDEAALWICEQDVCDLMNLGDAIVALEEGLRLEAGGEARNLEKTHVEWGAGATLHAIGATIPGASVAGTKTWAHTGGGATPLVVLWNAESGALEAVIEAFALGQLRTAAMTGVATRWLTAPEANELALIGTGKQALPQMAAVAAVRPIWRLRVFGRDTERRAAFRERVRVEGFDIEIVEADCVAEAVADAPIVTLVTRATEPFLEAWMVASGAHVNAIGAIVPSRQEFSADLFPRATLVAVDSISAVRKLSREFREWYDDGDGDWSSVVPINQIVAERRARPVEADLTLFKAMGMGISDLSLAIEVVRRARAEGRGAPVSRPARAKPQLRLETPIEGGPS